MSSFIFQCSFCANLVPGTGAGKGCLAKAKVDTVLSWGSRSGQGDILRMQLYKYVSNCSCNSVTEEEFRTGPDLGQGAQGDFPEEGTFTLKLQNE